MTAGQRQGARPTPSRPSSLAQAGRQGGTAGADRYLRETGRDPWSRPSTSVSRAAAPPRRPRRGARAAIQVGIERRAPGFDRCNQASRGTRCCAAAAAAGSAAADSGPQGGRQQACLRRAGHAVLAGDGSTMAPSPASGLSRRQLPPGTEVLHQQAPHQSGSSLRAPLCWCRLANGVRRHGTAQGRSSPPPPSPPSCGPWRHQADLTHVGLATGVGAAGPVGTHRFRAGQPSLQLLHSAWAVPLVGQGKAAVGACRWQLTARPAGRRVGGGSAGRSGSASSALAASQRNIGQKGVSGPR